MAALVRIEAINFDTTIADVNDLSTQRGGGLASLAGPRALAIRTAHDLGVRFNPDADIILAGASICLFWLETELIPDEIVATILALAHREAVAVATGDSDAAALDHLELESDPNDANVWQRLVPILPHLRFAAAAVKSDRNAAKHDSERLELLAKVRLQQLQTPTVIPPAPVPGSWQPCKANPNLPARAGLDYSDSVSARRQFGRAQKRAFYNDPAYGIGFMLRNGAVFARDLDDLVWGKPGWVRQPVANKIAHVFMDGNNFTKIREGLIGRADSTLDMERRFGKQVLEFRGRLLHALLTRFSAWGENTMFAQRGGRSDAKDQVVFRWETLLWGGDEAAFVLPAWAVPELLAGLAEDFGKDWTVEKVKLTHKVGIFITDRKTPIAIARRVAEALADSAKAGAGGGDVPNVAQIMISESVEPPLDIHGLEPETLAAYRERRYGDGAPAHYTLNLDKDYQAFVDGLAEVQAVEGGLPRSQLYSILRNQTEPDIAFARSGATCARVFERACFGAGAADVPLLPYQRIAELLDYFPPDVPATAAPAVAA